jgi:hypothetical protein
MAAGNYFKGGLEYRADGSLAMTPPYTLEERKLIDDWRRNLRLKIARENYERARDRYLEMKMLYLEQQREEDAIN